MAWVENWCKTFSVIIARSKVDAELRCLYDVICKIPWIFYSLHIVHFLVYIIVCLSIFYSFLCLLVLIW